LIRFRRAQHERAGEASFTFIVDFFFDGERSECIRGGIGCERENERTNKRTVIYMNVNVMRERVKERAKQ